MMFQVDDPKLVLREIKKLQPLNDNQFFWWRRFTTKTKPLPNNASFFDKSKSNLEYWLNDAFLPFRTAYAVFTLMTKGKTSDDCINASFK